MHLFIFQIEKNYSLCDPEVLLIAYFFYPSLMIVESKPESHLNIQIPHTLTHNDLKRS